MNFTKASVSRGMKNLRENGYLTVDDYVFISLTEKQKKIAEKIYEIHQLLTEFFCLLGVDRNVSQLDACKIEYNLSDETFNSIKSYIKNYKKRVNVFT